MKFLFVLLFLVSANAGRAPALIRKLKQKFSSSQSLSLIEEAVNKGTFELTDSEKGTLGSLEKLQDALGNLELLSDEELDSKADNIVDAIAEELDELNVADEEYEEEGEEDIEDITEDIQQISKHNEKLKKIATKLKGDTIGLLESVPKLPVVAAKLNELIALQSEIKAKVDELSALSELVDEVEEGDEGEFKEVIKEEVEEKKEEEAVTNATELVKQSIEEVKEAKEEVHNATEEAADGEMIEKPEKEMKSIMEKLEDAKEGSLKTIEQLNTMIKNMKEEEEEEEEEEKEEEEEEKEEKEEKGDGEGEGEGEGKGEGEGEGKGEGEEGEGGIEALVQAKSTSHKKVTHDVLRELSKKNKASDLDFSGFDSLEKKLDHLLHSQERMENDIW